MFTETVASDASLLKENFSGIAFVLTFLLFLPYIRSIWRRHTVPHVFSWLIWAFATFVVFLAQLADGGGIACLFVAIFLLARRYMVGRTHGLRGI